MLKPGSKKFLMIENFKRSQAGKSVKTLPQSNSVVDSEIVISDEKKGKHRNAKTYSKENGWSKKALEKELNRDDFLGHCMRKMAKAAGNFDNVRTGHMLKAFHTVSLEYRNFRVFLKKIFELEYTDKEFAEICNFYDTANTGSVIDGSEFLKCYIILRSIYLGENIQKIRKVEKAYLKRLEEEEKNYKSKMESKLATVADYNFTEEDRAATLEKLRVCAANYHQQSSASMGLHGFEISKLSLHDFKTLMKSTFNLILDAKDLGVLMKIYANEGENTIESSKFLRKFLKLGHAEREKLRIAQLKSCREAVQNSKKYHEDLIKAAEMKMEIGVNANFEEKDQISALEKIRIAAGKYRKDHPSSVGLDGFNGQYLTPGQFKEMLKRTFNINVSKQELSALVYAFDTDSNAKVKCSQFLLYFNKIGFMERSKEYTNALEKQRKLQEIQVKEHQQKLEDQWGKLELSEEQLETFTEAQMQSGMNKLRYAARWYDNSTETGVTLKGFVGATMSPAVFKEMCKRCLQVKLTMGELAAIVSVYRKHPHHAPTFDSFPMSSPLEIGNGSISSFSSQESSDILSSPIIQSKQKNASTYVIDLNKFRTNFGTMSFEEKEKVRESERKKKLLSIEKLKTEEQKRKEKEDLLLLGSDAIDFDYTEQEEKLAIKKLKAGAASFDHTTSLHGFNVSAMAPRELKDLIRRIFNVTLTPKEFGGLCHDMVRPNGYIDIDKFLATFMHMRREHSNKVRLQSIEAEKKLIEAREAEEKVRAAKRHIENAARLHHEHQDEVSLMIKMKKVAQMYAIDSGAFNDKLKSFKGPAKSATAFRNTFELVFLTRLTHAEVGVLMNTMDPRMCENQMIDGAKFLLGFFKLVRLQEKVLLGVITDDNLDITVFQQDHGRVVSSNKEDVSETVKPEEDDGFFATRGKKEIKPVSMVTKIMGVNPWVDWGIGDKAVNDGLHNRPATSVPSDVKEAYLNKLHHIEPRNKQPVFSATGDWLSLTSPVKTSNDCPKNEFQNCPKSAPMKSRSKSCKVGAATFGSFSRPNTASETQLNRRNEVLKRSVKLANCDMLPAIDI